MKAVFTCAAIGALALTSACSSTPPAMNVKSSWGGEMRQYGFTPIYPPRENLYVGDIYLLVENPCPNGGESSVFQTVLLGTLPASDIQALETSFDGTRPELPATPQPKPAASSDTPSAANQALSDAVQKDQAAILDAQTKFAAAAATLAKTNNATNQAALAAAAAKVKSANDALTADQAKLAAANPKGGAAPAPNAPAPAANQALSDAVQKDQTAVSTAQAGFVAAAAALAKTNNAANQAALVAAAAKVKSANDALTADQAKLAAANTKAPNAQASAPPANAMTPQPVATSDDPIFPDPAKPRGFTRLRLAAFPEMKLGSVSNVELAGSGPFAGIANLGGGVGRNAQTQVDVSVSGVEEDTVPISAFYSKVVAYIQSQNTDNSIFAPWLIKRLQARLEGAMITANPKCGTPQPYDPLIVFVPHVFYARTFDFGFSDSSAIAAFLKASISTPVAAGAAPAAGGANAGGAAPTSADTLTSNLTALAGSGSPGVGVSASFSTSGGISLKQTFERPLAFGFDESVAIPYGNDLPYIMDPSLKRPTARSPAAPTARPAPPPPAPKSSNAGLRINPGLSGARLYLAADTAGPAQQAPAQGNGPNESPPPCDMACQIGNAPDPICPPTKSCSVHTMDIANPELTGGQPKPDR